MSTIRGGRLLAHILSRRLLPAQRAGLATVVAPIRVNVADNVKILSLGANMKRFSSNLGIQIKKTKDEEEGRYNQPHSSLQERIDVKLHNINMYAQRTGRVAEKGVCEILDLMEKNGTCTPNQALFTLRCCGGLLVDVPNIERQALADRLWNYVTKFKVKLAASHFNTLLKVYIDNENDFSPPDILAMMDEHDVSPNRVTFQHLVTKYCMDGDIPSATTILEHMKELDMPVSEQVFHALIFGHAKLGDLDAADRVLEIMGENGLGIDHSAYVAKLTGMIHSGQNIEEVKAEMMKAINKGIFFDDHDYFHLIIACCKKGHTEAAKSFAEQLPRKTGYFQVMRNNIPQIIQFGNEDLALAMLSHFEAGPMSTIKNPDNSTNEYGLFFLKIMVVSKYTPAQVLDNLEKMNKPEEHLKVVLRKLVEIYIMNGKFDEGKEFLEAARARYGSSLIKLDGPEFIRTIRIHCNRNYDDAEDVQKFVANMIEMGVNVPIYLLCDTLIPSLLATKDLLLANLRSFYDEVKEFPHAPSWGHFSASAIMHMLNQDSHEEFAKVVWFINVNNYRQLFPMAWKNSLARNYLITKDLDSLMAIYFAVGPLKSDSQGKTSESLFKSLVYIHSEAHRYVNDRSADEVLDEVLKKMIELDFGIPPSVAAELKNIVQSEEIVGRIDRLKDNFEKLGELWTPEKIEECGRKFKESNFEKVGGLAAKQPKRRMRRDTFDPSSSDMPTRAAASKMMDTYLKNKQFDKLYELREKMSAGSAQPFFFKPTIVHALIMEKFKETGDAVQAVEEVIANAELDKNSSKSLYVTTFLEIAEELIQKNQLDECLSFFKLISKYEDQLMSESALFHVKQFVINLTTKVEDASVIQPIVETLADVLKMPEMNSLEGFKVLHLLKKGDREGALQAFEQLASEDKKLYFVPHLTKEFVSSEDKERMQRVLDASIKVKGEEVSLYNFTRIFIEMGRKNQARKLMQTPGLRYNDRVAAAICHRLKANPEGCEEFAKLCLPLFGSDKNFLFDILLNASITDANRIEEVWELMQEMNYFPNDAILEKMAGIFKKHGKEVPFDAPNISKEVTSAVNSLTSPITLAFNQHIAIGSFQQAAKDFQEAIDAQVVAPRMVLDMIKAMQRQSNFRFFEPFVKSIAASRDRKLRDKLHKELDKVSLSVLNAVDLSEEEKKFLSWNSCLAEETFNRNGKNKSAIDSIDDSQLPYLNHSRIQKMVSSIDVAQAFAEKADRAQNGLFISKLFITCVAKDLHSIAEELTRSASFNIDTTIDVINGLQHRTRSQRIEALLQFSKSHKLSDELVEKVESLRSVRPVEDLPTVPQ